MTTTKQFGAKGWTPEKLGSLAGKTYVITGANAGAGFEATRVFLSKGAKVVMMNRNADKSTAAIATLKQEFGSDTEVTFVQLLKKYWQESICRNVTQGLSKGEKTVLREEWNTRTSRTIFQKRTGHLW